LPVCPLCFLCWITVVKYSVITFGCRVNQADSLGFEEELLGSGAVSVAPQDADLVIVNSCSVTSTADQGTRQTIRRIARDNPAARIVVTGCYATRRPEEVAALPNVERVVVNDDKPRLIPLLRAGTAEHATIAEKTSAQGDGPCGSAIEPGVAGRTAFTLRVQTGCAEPCSYCIIPTTRGAPRSVPIETILRDVERVTAAGFKEIALTGVHLGSYGRDLQPSSSLLDLLHALDDEGPSLGSVRLPASAPSQQGGATARPGRGAARESWQPDRDPPVLFRISSLEPMDCSREIVDLVALSDRFAPHFHLPLQHASNRVLTAMRRPYTIEYYALLVDDIRARMPNASIGSDIIVGFPGETDDDFEQLAAYLARSPLTHIHVFPYSDRAGTPAAAMGCKVNGAIVRERGKRIREIGRELVERFRASQVGTTHRALTLDDGTLAVTGNYLKVRIPPGCRRNERVSVRLTSHDHGELLCG
jgi:threonylcarbamoyladenosine tRNA methylthiotransferase MtaB